LKETDEATNCEAGNNFVEKPNDHEDASQVEQNIVPTACLADESPF